MDPFTFVPDVIARHGVVLGGLVACMFAGLICVLLGNALKLPVRHLFDGSKSTASVCYIVGAGLGIIFWILWTAHVRPSIDRGYITDYYVQVVAGIVGGLSVMVNGIRLMKN